MRNVNLSDEFIAKAKECKSFEEFKELAQQEGINFTDEDFEAFAGGVDEYPTDTIHPWWICRA